MTTEQQKELDTLRYELGELLFHSTFMGGIHARQAITYDHKHGNVDALRACKRLMTISNDPFQIVAVVRILQDHGGRHLIPLLTEDYVRAYIAVNNAQQTQALHSGKRQSDSDLHNGRDVCMLVFEDLSREAAVCSIILDRGIIEAHEIKLLLNDMKDVSPSLSSGVL
jgi:hypothetical protein